jgi:hypothetical protein
MLWPMEDATEILRWYRGVIAKAPNALNGFFALEHPLKRASTHTSIS